ncbi:MAG: tetratricopeptide repeat protein [Sedimentisphaerales bacterium]|nr:tetratricopeptide repeat protein [Sedimentisphaerales bacterium]
MPRQTTILTALAAGALLTAFSTVNADVWRLDQDEDWRAISPQDKFLVAVSDVKKLVNTGKTEDARRAYEQLKKDFPALADKDLDAFIDAEILFSQGSFTKAYRAYEKIMRDQPQTRLRPAVLDRQFAIGTAYLGGQQKVVLRIVKLKGDAEGVKIMEKITDRAGIDSILGLRAAIAVAQNYNKRQMFADEYLKWWEISLQYKTGRVAKDALLGMAKSKHAIYNKQPPERRPFYDAANLKTARTYYQKFTALYPEDADELGIAETINLITEQLAEKQLTIAKYYDRTGKTQSANLYYDMVTKDYPGTQAAQEANQSRIGNIDL